MVNLKRARTLIDKEYSNGSIIYWMSRDQRSNDNWALLFAQEMAKKHKTHFEVVFCLQKKFLDATIRHFDFMLKGLEEVKQNLEEKNIPFHILEGKPEDVIPAFISKNKIGMFVTDFDPLLIKKLWKRDVARKIDVPFFEVDAHNVVPCWVASPKQEFGAYTIRPKIHKILSEFMDEFPKLEKQQGKFSFQKIDFVKLAVSLEVNRDVREVEWIKPGEKEAKKMLKEFIEKRLDGYAINKNDPNKDAVSHLSPYLHFGQISAQKIALEITRSGKDANAVEVFLEELVVRRELADNFCNYNLKYASFEGFPEWARKSLDEHRGDLREYVYSQNEFEEGKTHDELWNACQIEMVKTGKMHGYMRMYWAKKILEWTATPEDAMKIAIYLNDKYELDGRDPNGYVGIAWSIGGVHDRAWFNRPVFGKVRFMSYNGCKGKFDVDAYIRKIAEIK